MMTYRLSTSFQNYDSLEKHFTHAHHPCPRPECQARKFVVFNSVLDLKAHMLDEHHVEMSSKDKKDARRIQPEFEFEEVGAGRRGRNRELVQPSPQHAGPSRPTIQNRRREGFGASLTVESNTTANPPAAQQTRRLTPSPPREDNDPVITQ